MIAQPLGADGEADESPYVAIDPIGAAKGDTVVVSSDSPYVRKLLGTNTCLLYTSPSPRDQRGSRMPSSA